MGLLAGAAEAPVLAETKLLLQPSEFSRQFSVLLFQHLHTPDFLKTDVVDFGLKENTFTTVI